VAYTVRVLILTKKIGWVFKDGVPKISNIFL
jgi:hypothetical protein